MEKWVQIEGTNFEVSDLGRVRVFRIIKLNEGKFGYLRTYCRKGSRHLTLFVHRLVAEAFVGPRPSDNHFVNHKDCNKKNNLPSNLEWVTRKENAEHAIENGRYRTGHDHYKAKLTNSQARQMQHLYKTGRYTFSGLGKLFGVTKSTAHKIVRGKTHAIKHP